MSNTSAVFACILTPQGRYLYEFILVKAPSTHENCFYMLTPKETAESLVAFLMRYKLRRNVHLSETALQCYRGNLIEPHISHISFSDPRHQDLPPIHFTSTSLSGASEDNTAYTVLRHGLSLAEGPQELFQEKAVILEFHFDKFNGISWTKGCYLGQELIARTKHRGGINKVCVGFTHTLSSQALSEKGFKIGASILCHDKAVGRTICISKKTGLCFIRLEHAEFIAANGFHVHTAEGHLLALNTPLP